MDGSRIDLEIYDTTGQSEFKAFRDLTISYADGFLVIFSLCDKVSFEDAKKLALDCRDIQHKPVLFVGNKRV